MQLAFPAKQLQAPHLLHIGTCSSQKLSVTCCLLSAASSPCLPKAVNVLSSLRFLQGCKPASI